MDMFKFVEMAKSDDETRYNLTRVYRAKDRLVATDGYRMHWMPQPIIETPHFIDGHNGEYPNVIEIIPTTPTQYTIELLSKNLLPLKGKLKALLSMAKEIDRRGKACRFIFKGNDFGIQVSDSTSRASVETNHFEPEMVIGLNLSYLLDALSFEKSDRVQFNIDIRGEGEPVLIKRLSAEGEAFALIMPMRLGE